MALAATAVLASMTTGVSAAAGSSEPASLGVAEQPALPAGVHTPSAAERRALPAALRSVAAAVSYPAYVENWNSFSCMEVYHSATANGSKVDQWTCNHTNTQKWTWILLRFGEGWQAVNLNSGKCLDTTGNHADGVQMTIWACETGNTNQIFMRNAVPGSDFLWTAQPRWSTGGICLEVFHSSIADGAPVDHYKCNGTDTQEWFEQSACPGRDRCS